MTRAKTDSGQNIIDPMCDRHAPFLAPKLSPVGWKYRTRLHLVRRKIITIFSFPWNDFNNDSPSFIFRISTFRYL